MFAACARYGKAVEINCQPSRRDPPDELIRLAKEQGCSFAINTDGHSPGELTWLPLGCDRATEAGIPAERIINTLPADGLLAWAASHDARAVA